MRAAGLRKSALGDTAFTKEELALISIRDDATLNLGKQAGENETGA